MQEAIEADPRNPLAKFERASVLLSEDRYREALDELNALKVGSIGLCLHLRGWEQDAHKARMAHG